VSERSFDDLRIEARDPDGLREVLGLLVEGARERLGDAFVGAYLQGSLASGDFDDASDVDFLIVVREDVPEDRVPELQAFHETLFEHPCYWARHLEGSYVCLEDLRALPPPRRKLLYLDHGSTTFERSVHDHDLPVLWILRERGVTLTGPPPRTLVPPVSSKALAREVRKVMRAWGAEILGDPDSLGPRWLPPFAVLTYCRMRQTIETGEIRSKKEGARWGRTTLDGEWHDLIDWSWRERRRLPGHYHEPADEAIAARTREFVRVMLAAIG
jgi:predicted nucleotidyltransferase